MKLRPEEITSILRRQIEAETQRALGEIRREVAQLALIATEKVTAGALDANAHRKLIDDAIRELDFSALEQAET